MESLSEKASEVSGGEFFVQLENKCREENLPFDKIKEAFLSLMGEDKIVAYYFTRGFKPENPQIKLDLLTVSERALYGLNVGPEGIETIFLKLQGITLIEELVRKANVKVTFRFGLAAYFLVDELTRLKALRDFVRIVKELWLSLE